MRCFARVVLGMIRAPIAASAGAQAQANNWRLDWADEFDQPGGADPAR